MADTVQYTPIGATESLLTGIRRVNNTLGALRKTYLAAGANPASLRYVRQASGSADYDYFNVAFTGTNWTIGFYPPGATSSAYQTIYCTDTRLDTMSIINDAMSDLRSSFAGSSAPTNSIKGIKWWNTDTKLLNVFNGTTWGTVSTFYDGIRYSPIFDEFIGTAGNPDPSIWNEEDTGAPSPGNVSAEGGVLEMIGNGSWDVNGVVSVTQVTKNTGDHIVFGCGSSSPNTEALFAISTYSSLAVNTGLQIRTDVSENLLVYEDTTIINTFSIAYVPFDGNIQFELTINATGYTLTLYDWNNGTSETFAPASSILDAYSNYYIHFQIKTNAVSRRFTGFKYSKRGYGGGSTSTYQDFVALTTGMSYADSVNVINNSINALKYVFEGSAIPPLVEGQIWRDVENGMLYVFNGTTVSSISTYPYIYI